MANRGVVVLVLDDPCGQFAVWQHGSPATFLTNYTVRRLNIRNGPWDLTHAIHTFRWVALVFDAAVCLILLSSTVIAVELFSRRRRLQFGIRSLLALIAAVAILLTLHSQGFIEWEHLIYVPIGFSLVSLVGIMSWPLVRIFGRNRHTQAALRSWNTLHRTTIVVFLLTEFDICIRQLRGVFLHGRNEWQHGWPISYVTRSTITLANTGPWDVTSNMIAFSWAALVVDATVSLLLLASTGIAVELFLRRPQPFQFGVKSLLGITAVVAYVFLLRVGRIIDWEDMIYFPVGFSILCFIGLIFWFLMRTARRSRNTTC